MAGRFAQGDHYCYRGEDAGTSARASQLCGSNQDPSLDCSLCQQATTNVPRDPKHYDRHHCLCRRRRNLASNTATLCSGLFRRSANRWSGNESASQILRRQDDSMGSSGCFPIDDQKHRDRLFGPHRRRYPLSIRKNGGIPNSHPERP